jgi:hypothetical protein
MTLVCVAGGLLAAPLRADDLPPDRLVTYRLHDDPTDTGSAVSWTILLTLSPVERAGNDVHWEVVYLEIHDVAEGRKWDIVAPLVDTSTGGWWVTHADAAVPAAEEFVLPPRIAGDAPALAGTTERLAFCLEGREYAPPPAGQLWNVTGALSHSFTVGDDDEPTKEGPDEPAEIRPVGDPGGAS